MQIRIYDEYTYELSDRKTRSDVLTPWDAVDARKSSKNHKLKPRSRKRDKTKMQEAKFMTRMRAAERDQ